MTRKKRGLFVNVALPESEVTPDLLHLPVVADTIRELVLAVNMVDIDRSNVNKGQLRQRQNDRVESDSETETFNHPLHFIRINLSAARTLSAAPLD